MRTAFALGLVVIAACKRDQAATTPPPSPPITPTSPDAAPVAEAVDCEGPVRHWAALVGGTTEENIAASIATCRTDGWSAAVLACLNGATNAAAAEACVRPVLAPDTALQLLEMIELTAGIAAAGQGFPIGTSGPTPAQACCDSVDQLCHTAGGDWQASVWTKLGFYVDGASPFQFSYESADGAEMVVRAVADLDCDGAPIVWELRGSWNAVDGDLYKVSEPDLGAD